jgi:hypothetical protein
MHDKFTKEDVYGKNPVITFSWGALYLCGLPYLYLHFENTYPLLDGDNNQALAITGAVAFAIGMIVCVLWRNQIMPWGHKAKAICYLVIVSMNVPVAFLAMAVFLFLNGAFNNHDDFYKVRYKDIVLEIGGYYRHYTNIEVTIGKGFLGQPWIAKIDHISQP